MKRSNRPYDSGKAKEKRDERFDLIMRILQLATAILTFINILLSLIFFK
ncbi:hypothetical protein [Mammaliicoccus sciuri]|nr:hypothetical protein [Mammaliicoccus sciuri]